MPIEGTNTRFWPAKIDDKEVGVVTSAVYSPRLERNIALAMVSVESAGKGSELIVCSYSGDRPATVVDVPFVDPEKQRAKSVQQ